MPFALIFVAVALIIAGFRGTQKCLFSLIQQDASGQFLAWMVAIFIVGGIGYIKALEPISNALLILLIVVLFISRGGVFTQLSSAVTMPTTSTATTATPTATITGLPSLPKIEPINYNFGLPG